MSIDVTERPSNCIQMGDPRDLPRICQAVAGKPRIAYFQRLRAQIPKREWSRKTYGPR